MARVVSTGAQDFATLIENNCFYVDKSAFIKEWWESLDIVTLIARPRRFGKTLNINMLDRFWNIKYQGQGDIFQNLNIWKEEKYRKLQGTYPVISLTFAGVKETSFTQTRKKICRIIKSIYNKFDFLLDSELLNESEKEDFCKISVDMEDHTASDSIKALSDYLCRYYGQKVIILLDEYDTPMQEAYVNGYWDDLAAFMRNLFNNTFKTNPYLERAIMTGITCVSRESMFSDLNNLNVIAATSDEYASCFGFTEAEVFAAMDEFGMENKEDAKSWYDGFTFGSLHDIYNPWSIINFLNKKKLDTYWANTSSNKLVSRLLQRSGRNIKMQFEELLENRSILSEIDEEIAYSHLEQDESAIWSLLLASGYLKVLHIDEERYELSLTNYEVWRMFAKMVRTWFRKDEANYNDFIKSLLRGDLEEMNYYINSVAESMFSSFDGGSKPSPKTNPERFYHGFVLGLLVDLRGKYVVTSNRESGLGRYDVLLEPLDKSDDGIILEFKIYNPKKEKTLEETVQAALSQIEQKRYEQTLLDHGVAQEHIRKYGFAFKGKNVLIG